MDDSTIFVYTVLGLICQILLIPFGLAFAIFWETEKNKRKERKRIKDEQDNWIKQNKSKSKLSDLEFPLLNKREHTIKELEYIKSCNEKLIKINSIINKNILEGGVIYRDKTNLLTEHQSTKIILRDADNGSPFFFTIAHFYIEYKNSIEDSLRFNIHFNPTANHHVKQEERLQNISAEKLIEFFERWIDHIKIYGNYEISSELRMVDMLQRKQVIYLVIAIGASIFGCYRLAQNKSESDIISQLIYGLVIFICVFSIFKYKNRRSQMKFANAAAMIALLISLLLLATKLKIF